MDFTKKKYSNHPLVKWVDKFMARANLYPDTDGGALVAVSGGADSMLLLFILKQLKWIKNIRAIHIDHGVRDDTNLDCELISSYCSILNIPLKIAKLDDLKRQSNFEHVARKKRYATIYENIALGDLIYTGHHIDDSFEWSLLCQFKTGSTKNTLGIPLVNKNIRRPLMCLTRKQIDYFIKELNIPFREDSTNTNLSYERNYLRHKFIPELKNKFPNILKHYVFRSNDMARSMNLSRLCQEGDKHFYKFQDRFGGIILVHPLLTNDFYSAELQILEIIKELSTKERGVLREQVKKLIEANLNQKRGPLLFSGGVYAYCFFGIIYFCSKANNKFEYYDKKIIMRAEGSHIPEMSLTQYKKKLITAIFKNKTPVFWAIGSSKKINKVLNSAKKIDDDFILTSSYAIESKLWYGNPYKLLQKWSGPRNYNKLLPIKIDPCG